MTREATITGRRMHWIRILVTALAVEVALIVATLPLLILFELEAIVAWIPAFCLVVGFAVTYALTRPIRSAHVLHGILIGLVATALYLVLVWVGNGSLNPVVETYGLFLFILANGLRVVGTTLGAVIGRN